MWMICADSSNNCYLNNYLYLFLQAIVNEDASGDVIAMRIQIQQLKVY